VILGCLNRPLQNHALGEFTNGATAGCFAMFPIVRHWAVTETNGFSAHIRPRGSPAQLSDALVLTFPNESRFFALVRLVLSGLAAQLDLPYEQVDDLQLAVEGALAGESPPGDVVTLRIEPREESLSVSLSPISSGASSNAEGGDGLGFNRIAGKLVDVVEIVTVDGSDWLRLEKRIPAGIGDSGAKT